MSAKPYHAGHDGLVRIAAAENDEVHLFVSLSNRERPGEMPIYGADMKVIWERFIEPSLPTNVDVIYVPIPVRSVYEELEMAEEEGSADVFQIYSDSEDILKYTDDALVKSAPTLMEEGRIVLRGVDRSETVNVSGTAMRKFLSMGDVENFGKFLPPAIQKHAGEIIAILRKKQ
jgi:nicotinamide mononucleotide adenylyltransferase